MLFDGFVFEFLSGVISSRLVPLVLGWAKSIALLGISRSDVAFLESLMILFLRLKLVF